MIVRVIAGRRSLEPYAHGQTQVPGQRNPSHYQAGSQENLLVACSAAVRPKRRVHFQLRPELSMQPKLDRGIMGNGIADLHLFAGGERNAQGALYAEISPSFSGCKSGCEDGMPGANRIGPGG